ncbi:2-phosphosulfolactate phosphatase [Nocardioides guangzhouensis]|uniref:Probable 2-phosphosulfolactate phosphatase n=1 Tax=Nocardioides guangzhouensis TaxID=2497878 RepID=A0A4Q4ZMR1_9ACTN|nr:2-phosphosulfolactate phosphatase [Nocardioides guangzhouensis]RYP88754.1 2-phosphosulfolactate phosphatase [Nocardioides guangzhouensis]
MTRAAHRQATYPVRFDWGPTGADAIADGAAYAVVVDVLSFTTTVTVAVERGIAVHPFAWKDERAGAYAASLDAALAIGRHQARRAGGGISLSPASVATATGVERLVLPSPNGSTIAARLADSGATVVAAGLRNRRAVAEHLADRLGGGGLAVVAGGERWPDGSLRPAVEDLWGAGAVLAALADLGVGGFSAEAELAAAAFRAVEPEVAAALRACASGRELVDGGFPQDVAVAGEIDASRVVPVLADGAFTDAAR